MFDKIRKKSSASSQLEAEYEEKFSESELEDTQSEETQEVKEAQEAVDMTEDAVVNNTLYRFSVPNPMPKDLVAVLTEMFKKLFPDTRKAYLVYTQYEEKSGYLVVVDIDARFHKIINLYLDGETKIVRNGLPIASILYSKSGTLTEGMRPFYRREIADNGIFGYVSEFSYMDTGSEFLMADTFDFESEIASFDSTESDEASDETIQTSEEQTVSAEAAYAEEPSEENEIDATQVEFTMEDAVAEPSVKVKPETKQQLFALMNRIGKNDSEDALGVASSAFGEFEFYIPYTTEDDTDKDVSEISAACPDQARHFHLINRDTGIKATVFFTDEESAVAFAETNGCLLAKMRYADYKSALMAGTILLPSAEGVLINPDAEKLLLPPDFPLL